MSFYNMCQCKKIKIRIIINNKQIKQQHKNKQNVTTGGFTFIIYIGTAECRCE